MSAGVYGEALRRTTYRVEMRDGVKLATDVYLPSSGGPAFPVVFGRTPYGKQNSSSLSDYNSYKIAAVVQDVRGINDSEGVPRPLADDGWGQLQDAYDTVQWMRAQEWCNGSIATVGYSAGAMLQVQLAGAAPPGIVGQLIESGPLSSYHTTFFNGGVFRKSLTETWMAVVGFTPESLIEMRSHPHYDSHWREQNLAERIEHVDWPVSLVGGWFDIFQQGTIDLFTEIRSGAGNRARENLHMLIGPWTHAGQGHPSGQLSFPNRETPSVWPSRNDWFRHWLQDRALSPTLPKVIYYTMGEVPGYGQPGNEWRTAEDWPPPSVSVPFYLSFEGGLGRAKPPEGSREFVYDPNDPVPTNGGPNLVLPAGAFDQRDQEARGDVLVFTSEPLSQPLEVTGRITAVLYVSTSAADTDFTAKLCDVYPDGRSMLFNDGVQRLSLRTSLAAPEPVVPAQLYRLEVDLWSTSLIFNTGHRIRLSVSSSNSPRFEPNPNTGNANVFSSEKTTAEQTVYLGGANASHLSLPVIGEAANVPEWEAYSAR